MKKLLLFAALLAAIAAPAQKWEGLGQTPPMGWNSWNRFNRNINESLIREIADAMTATGLADAGYTYIVLDDFWHADTRDADGFPRCDSARFPSGMKALADYVHDRDLKLGIYSCAGRKTCGGRFGSFGHEYQDALQYARWGIDYLKYDWCNSKNINPIGAYTLMSEALRAAGRPIFFALCEWGDNQPWDWAEPLGHSWRTTGDIACSFEQEGAGEYNSVLRIIDLNARRRKHAGPGHWNDPDMLQVGNGMSENEDRAHFSMWCMFSAPLILGNDIRGMSEATFAIVSNPEAIAIDQDPLGVQALRHSADGELEFWFKPLANGDWAFCILNRGRTGRDCTIDWPQFDLTDEEVSGRATGFSATTYTVHDIWAGGQKSVTTRKPLRINVPGHDVKLYRLTPTITKK